MDDFTSNSFSKYPQVEWPAPDQSYPVQGWSHGRWASANFNHQSSADASFHHHEVDKNSCHFLRSPADLNTHNQMAGRAAVPSASGRCFESTQMKHHQLTEWREEDTTPSDQLVHGSFNSIAHPDSSPRLFVGWEASSGQLHPDGCSGQLPPGLPMPVPTPPDQAGSTRVPVFDQRPCSCAPGPDQQSLPVHQDFESFIDQFLGDCSVPEARQVYHELGKSCVQAGHEHDFSCTDATKLTAQLSGIIQKCARDREKQRQKERSAKLKHALRSFTNSGRSCLSEQQREAVEVQVLEQLMQKASEMLAAKGGKVWKAYPCECRLNDGCRIACEEMPCSGVRLHSEGLRKQEQDHDCDENVVYKDVGFASKNADGKMDSGQNSSGREQYASSSLDRCTPETRIQVRLVPHARNQVATSDLRSEPSAEAVDVPPGSGIQQGRTDMPVTREGVQLTAEGECCNSDAGQPRKPDPVVTGGSHDTVQGSCSHDTDAAGLNVSRSLSGLGDREAAGSMRHITLSALQSVYDLPINEAAKKLGLGVTVLKKFCRKFEIPRWPYRKLKSLEKLIGSLQEDMMDQAPDSELLLTLEELKGFRQMILRDPSVDLEAKVKRLRQANFKLEYKQRQASRSSKDVQFID